MNPNNEFQKVQKLNKIDIIPFKQQENEEKNEKSIELNHNSQTIDDENYPNNHNQNYNNNNLDNNPNYNPSIKSKKQTTSSKFNKIQQSKQVIIQSKKENNINRSHHPVLILDDEESSKITNQGDCDETVFERIQIINSENKQNNKVKNDNNNTIINIQNESSIIDLQKSYNNNIKNSLNLSSNQMINNSAQPLDDMRINEDGMNYTLNRFQIDEIDQVEIDKQYQLHKLAETQQYIDDTFKNMISSQKQQHQFQLLQMQSSLRDNIEPPQCRICLEFQDEINEQEFNYNQSHIIDFKNTTNRKNSSYSNNPNNNQNNNNNNKGYLMSPCKCSGSSKYIHEKCLKEWIKQTYEDLSQAQCEICKQSYVMNLIYKNKFTCNMKRFNQQKQQQKYFIIWFIIWIICIHFFIITSIILLIEIININDDDGDNKSKRNKNKISNVAIYILFTIDILCDIICIFIFLRYYLYLFQSKVLVDWQIMNFTKHPKEKHPKLIEKYKDSKMISKECNHSASQRNIQLQLMMNNSLDNRNIINHNNSLHLNLQQGQGQNNNNLQQQQCNLTNSQVSKQQSIKNNNNNNNSSHHNSQRLVRNGSNAQTLNFFANMGVSEKILNDFLQMEATMNTPIQNDKNQEIKKCDSFNTVNDRQTKNKNQEIQQLKQMSQSPPILQIPSPQLSIFGSDKIQSRNLCNHNVLDIPLNHVINDMNSFRSNSAHLVQNNKDNNNKINNNKIDKQQEWQRHVFYAKNQSYEIIVKPSEINQTNNNNSNNNKDKIESPLEEIQLKEETSNNNSKQMKRNSFKSLKRFFEDINGNGQTTQQMIRNGYSNSTLQKVDSIIEVQEDDLDKNQQSQDLKSVFRPCESFESSSPSSRNTNEDINQDQEKQQNKQKEQNQGLQKIGNLFNSSSKEQIKQSNILGSNTTNNTINSNKKQQRMQDILFNKIQQTHPEIKQSEQYIKQSIENNTINNNIKQEQQVLNNNSNNNLGNITSSINTQINSKIISESQIQTTTTQIGNKSFLSSIHTPFMSKEQNDFVIDKLENNHSSNINNSNNQSNINNNNNSNHFSLSQSNQNIHEQTIFPQNSQNEEQHNNNNQNIQQIIQTQQSQQLQDENKLFLQQQDSQQQLQDENEYLQQQSQQQDSSKLQQKQYLQQQQNQDMYIVNLEDN